MQKSEGVEKAVLESRSGALRHVEAHLPRIRPCSERFLELKVERCVSVPQAEVRFSTPSKILGVDMDLADMPGME